MSFTAAVITVSDKGYLGQRRDTSGPAICRLAEGIGAEVLYKSIVPDDIEMIKAELIKCADELKLSLVLTTGGTGFAPSDVTPEATLAVIEREVRGIPEAMRAESLKITPRGCLSRSAAGIRGRTLIVNLPGSEKAARENFEAVSGALGHGLDMLASNGSADCAEHAAHAKKAAPSMDAWLREAKAAKSAPACGMYLFHNGTVRATAKAQARGKEALELPSVTALRLSCDTEKLSAAISNAEKMPGIHYVRVWVNEGLLSVGDDIMLALVGGDIRPNVISALEALVAEIKNECVTETEIF